MYVQNNPVIKFKQFHIKLNKNILYKDFFFSYLQDQTG